MADQNNISGIGLGLGINPMLNISVPQGLINTGDDNHLDNMANFSMLVNANNVINTPPTGDPLPQDANSQFGNWTGQTDTRAMAEDLKKRGLVGAQKIIDGTPSNTTDSNSIKNAPSDWIVNSIQHIVSNAKKYNLRTPEEINANKAVLTNTLDKRYVDALNNPSFKQNYPNFWDVITHSILPEQYKKFDSSKDLAKK